ncbi:Uclacyanin 1 [Camellia lanceoleosa]|uniref:Uclacyanin 1 n=1 Tax=Camellia lanceoleosa TaxID=1840588 RepID=A0ACC0IF79_9ERIC|nr:Uclacyanin 1 [Camellia lanceoleosa]
MAMATMAYLTVIALSIAAVASDTPAATQYTNHTVGGVSGWFFNTTTNTSSTNYTSWAASQTFNLGDYLIFNTNTNQTVIQTTNDTTYQSCSMDDASDDTSQYGGGSNQFGQAMVIPVPLTSQGTNYFFSGADDTIQCQQGMAFQIFVNHGLGLPPSLNQPPPPPYVEPPTPSDFPSPPGTVVTTNQQTSGGANLRWEIWDILFGACLLLAWRGL